MTKYWTLNLCAINQNTIFSNWNAQGYRKGLYTELFFLFFVYFISQVLQSLLYKQHQRKMNTAQQRSLRQGMAGNGNYKLLFVYRLKHLKTFSTKKVVTLAQWQMEQTIRDDILNKLHCCWYVRTVQPICWVDDYCVYTFVLILCLCLL